MIPAIISSSTVIGAAENGFEGLHDSFIRSKDRGDKTCVLCSLKGE